MRKKNIPGVFRLVSILFQIFVKGYEQKHFPRYFPIRKYDFLNIEKGMSKKIIPGIFRLVSMLFYLFEKKYEQKICPRYFHIGKYAFLFIWKIVWAKNMSQVFSDR